MLALVLKAIYHTWQSGKVLLVLLSSWQSAALSCQHHPHVYTNVHGYMRRWDTTKSGMWPYCEVFTAPFGTEWGENLHFHPQNNNLKLKRFYYIYLVSLLKPTTHNLCPDEISTQVLQLGVAIRCCHNMLDLVTPLDKSGTVFPSGQLHFPWAWPPTVTEMQLLIKLKWRQIMNWYVTTFCFWHSFWKPWT